MDKCNGKIIYDKKTAATARNWAKGKGRMVRIYPCPLGNHWHLTHEFKRQRRK